MPDFEKLHHHAKALADLTADANQHTGLGSWCFSVAEEWKAIVCHWTGETGETWSHRMLATARVPAPPASEAIREFERFVHDIYRSQLRNGNISDERITQNIAVLQSALHSFDNYKQAIADGATPRRGQSF